MHLASCPPFSAQRYDTGVNLNIQQKKYEKIESHVNSLSQEWSILLLIIFDCMYLIVSYVSVQCDAIFTRIFIIDCVFTSITYTKLSNFNHIYIT